MSYEMRTGYANDADSVSLVADVTTINLNDIGAADTYKLQPTRVDTATAGTKTALITFNATEGTHTADIQTKIRALGGIYADATVANGVDAAHKVITVFGGYDVTWAVTDATGFTPGATVETTEGGSVYTFVIPTPPHAKVARLYIPAFPDASVDFDISDRDDLDVYVKADLDISSGFDDFLIVDGVDDANAAVEIGPGVFAGTLKAIVTTSVPLSAGASRLAVAVLCESTVGNGRKRVLKRSSGSLAAAGSSQINLGAPFAVVRKLKLTAPSGDASMDFSFVDDLGKTFWAVTGVDADPAITKHVATDAILQDGSASADGGGGALVVKNPVTLTTANQTGTGASATLWLEV